MASAISHAVAALGIGAAFYRPSAPRRIWITGVACAVLPDLDVVGFRFGVHYGDFWGHRGFTHSLLFALIVSGVFTLWIDRTLPQSARTRLFVFLFLATASHGVLDAMTNGGLGVAFFSPFDNSRYFLPWRPIRVSPIGITKFFSARGLSVLQSEVLWIWVPTLLCILFVVFLRQRSEIRAQSRDSLEPTPHLIDKKLDP